MSRRVERVVTSGIFSLDGDDFEVDNNIWLVGDDDSVVIIDAAHQAGPIADAVAGRRVWLKGHGTGTLEAGRLESTALAAAFPDTPIVGWKGSLGHTLGSCGLVELAIACESIRAGRAPGTVGGAAPSFQPAVTIPSLPIADTAGVVCASNAFGGAHAAFFLRHA